MKNLIHCISTLFCFVFAFQMVKGQQVVLKIDTIYGKSTQLPDRVFFPSGQAGFFFHEDGRTEETTISSLRPLNYQYNHLKLATVNGKSLLYNVTKSQLSLPIDADLSLSTSNSMHFIDSCLLYRRKDSLFLFDFREKMSFYGGIYKKRDCTPNNSGYFQGESVEENGEILTSFHVFRSETTLILPGVPYFDRYMTTWLGDKYINKYLIPLKKVTKSPGAPEYIDVYDLAGKKIINAKEGFQEVYTTQDILLVTGTLVKSRLFLKGRAVPFSYSIKKVEVFTKGILKITLKNGNEILLDKNATVFNSTEYDEINCMNIHRHNALGEPPYFNFITNGINELRGSDLRLIHEGPYKEQKVINDSLLIVTSNLDRILNIKIGESSLPYTSINYIGHNIFSIYGDYGDYYALNFNEDTLFQPKTRDLKIGSKGDTYYFYEHSDGAKGKTFVYDESGELMYQYERNGFVFDSLDLAQKKFAEPNNVRIHRKKAGYALHQQLIDFDNNPLSPWLDKIVQIAESNFYFIETISKKQGVLEILN